MKKFSVIIYFFLIQVVFSQEVQFPNLVSRVNDYAHFLNQETIEILEKALANHEKKTTNQIVILTVDTIHPYTIEEYSIKIAEKWKIGQKNKDNGIIIILSKKERKVRIEVGYGLEGDLPDAICKRIIEEKMIPYFKQRDFDTGIRKGIEEIFKILKDTESQRILEEEIKNTKQNITNAKKVDITQDEEEQSKILSEKKDSLVTLSVIYLFVAFIIYIILASIIWDDHKKLKSFIKLTLITCYFITMYWIFTKIYLFFQEPKIKTALLEDVNGGTTITGIIFFILYLFFSALGLSSNPSNQESSGSWRRRKYDDSYSFSSSSWDRERDSSYSDSNSFSGGGGSFGGGGASGSW